MKKWSGGLVLVFFFAILLIRYVVVENPLAEMSIPSLFSQNNSEHLHWVNAAENLPFVPNPKNDSDVLSSTSLVAQLSVAQNLSDGGQLSLQTWEYMLRLVSHSNGLPQAAEAVKEAITAWKGLLTSLEDDKLANDRNGNKSKERKEKQCPYSVIRMNTSEFSGSEFRLKIPCGLVQGSSLTIIGTPDGILGNFKIDLIGTVLPGEHDPPIVLHYNVRLQGDKITEDPVIVQNTWSLVHDWGPEERCPSADHENNKKVDNLDRCSEEVGKDNSGLPTFEDAERVNDLELLKSSAFPIHKDVDLFIGVFSTANNFKQRMAVRRTWMQYDSVRSGAVLHKNQLVNEELWSEACTYGDIQLMPFVDYYNLITWKTVAICIYGTHVVSAKYVMKTDDDAFVRIDEMLSSLSDARAARGLLYGRISSEDHPNRDTNSKWYISPEEWPGQIYPPWAHGPGYVISKDVAMDVYKQFKNGHLKMFKLEDVAMGIWIDDMKKRGMIVKYVNEDRIHIAGCEPGYIVAHYQQPREMMCLWQKLQETNRAKCCGEG
ncbi:hypothetical protein HPP92_016833 [Vanilla planifolia]|uniref:Galectin domain-containing protein n=1 Tax=Vanilla planifolia TaxID=51239 RepID=A0A835QK34_VANPL|nr:hypothetical protein HPP92_016833 [Vanilla planifolia]